MGPWQAAAEYHEATKHHFHRHARSLGYLDWATQPDPFRRFEGAPLVPLLFAADHPEPAYDDLFEPGRVAAVLLTLESLSAFFEFSLSLSAWKEYRGSRWALRINPSSGNLHPTEGYLVIGPLDGLSDRPGVYHYAPKEHALEHRAELSPKAWRQLIEGFPPGTFLAGLTSIHWREAWKYGERAYRYCQHDAGHALAALSISAAVQGWSARLLPDWSDVEIAALLGLDRTEDFAEAEREHPDLLIAVAPGFGGAPRPSVVHEAVAGVAAGRWTGRANQLSADHVAWEAIDAVAAACEKSRSAASADVSTADSFEPALLPARPEAPACRIIHQRRSAVAFDGVTSITAERFYLMLDRVLPRCGRPPWDVLGSPVCVHLGLFVHRVVGLVPGLYCLVRRTDRWAVLRGVMRPSFQWEKPPGCPEVLPLYLLLEGDARDAAARLSCDQEIAGDSAFSLGMIAEFEEPLRRHGAWLYRRLFWETGVIGQVLYLEAEAAGVRATGIGCFYDDPVHALFGLTGRAFQSLYHFTIGGPVEDLRLTTLPPYPEERRHTRRPER